MNSFFPTFQRHFSINLAHEFIYQHFHICLSSARLIFHAIPMEREREKQGKNVIWNWKKSIPQHWNFATTQNIIWFCHLQRHTYVWGKLKFVTLHFYAYFLLTCRSFCDTHFVSSHNSVSGSAGFRLKCHRLPFFYRVIEFMGLNFVFFSPFNTIFQSWAIRAYFKLKLKVKFKWKNCINWKQKRWTKKTRKKPYRNV